MPFSLGSSPTQKATRTISRLYNPHREFSFESVPYTRSLAAFGTVDKSFSKFCPWLLIIRTLRRHYTVSSVLYQSYFFFFNVCGSIKYEDPNHKCPSVGTATCEMQDLNGMSDSMFLHVSSFMCVRARVRVYERPLFCH